jgi:hypothetical protein
MQFQVIPYADIERMEQAIGLMLLAQSEGLHPVTAFRRFHVMEDGRPAMKAEVVLAEYQKLGGKCEWLSDPADRHEQRARWTIDGITKEIGFTFREAIDAGYVKEKSNWLKDPAAQLRARAVTRAVRMMRPEVLGGLRTPEELADIPVETAPATWTPAPAAAGPSPEAVAHALAADHLAPPPAAAPSLPAPAAVPAQAQIGDLFGDDTPAALAYLVSLGWIKAGQTFANLNQGHEARIRKGLEKFRDAARKAYQIQGAQ